MEKSTLTHKLYCLRPACVWRTADNVCTWTVCPYGKRVQAAPPADTQPNPAPPTPTPKPKDRVNRSGKVIGTDESGNEHVYKSALAASRALGKSKSAIGNALLQGTKVCGMNWRYAD